tara:strand:- start:1436 stop:1564 length:129 start_codon:yes stop_codon:yes gene_type:complete
MAAIEKVATGVGVSLVSAKSDNKIEVKNKFIVLNYIDLNLLI